MTQTPEQEMVTAVEAAFDQVRQVYGDVVEHVDDAARFVVRNKLRILAVPTTIITAGAAIGLDVADVIPSWLAGVLASVVAVATMLQGGTAIAAKHATTADPALIPMDKYGGTLLDAGQAVVAATAVMTATVGDHAGTVAPVKHLDDADVGDEVDLASIPFPSE